MYVNFDFWDPEIPKKDMDHLEWEFNTFYGHEPPEVQDMAWRRLYKRLAFRIRMKQLGYILLFVFFIHLISR